MVKERQGPIRRKRGEPERQPSELNSHRIDVDAVKTSLRDGPAILGSVAIGDVIGRHASFPDEGCLVGRGQVSARGHQERSAAHRRIQHPQRKNRFRRGGGDEWREGPTDEILRQGPGSVEGAG